MGNGASASNSSVWTQTYNELKSKHDAAYVVIQNAITLDEQERFPEVYNTERKFKISN